MRERAEHSPRHRLRAKNAASHYIEPMPAASRSPVFLVISSLVVTAIEAALLMLGLGGPAALAASPRALVLVGIWAVSGVVLRVSQPVRGQDVSRAERDPLALLMLALLPLAIPGVAAWGGRNAWLPLPAAELLGWTGVALNAVGLAIRIGAMRQLGARFSPLVALQREHALETAGWYAWVRHPGYLGSQLANWGCAIAFGSGLALPLALLMTAFQFGRIRREEALLAEHFGDAWRAYARRTPALLPWPRGAGAPRANEP